MSEWILNHRASRGPAPAFFTDDELAEVRRYYATASGAPPTPLHRLPALARELGVGEILVKDESARFGLTAFKTTGVRYAMARLVGRPGGSLIDVAAATAGNHGLAVAQSAKELGLLARIYVPFGTDRARITALRREGAHVGITSSGYDDTVRVMREEARERGCTIVSDTAWEGYEEIPRWIMAGYTQILEEIAEAGRLDSADPRRVVFIVQAGVGSLAGAVAGWLIAKFGESRPALVIVEPAGSACVLASLRAGARTSLSAAAPTSMAGLRCAEVSTLAWPVLRDTVDAAVTVTDEQVGEATRRFAQPGAGEPRIDSGPSGAAGLAALMTLARDPDLDQVRARLPSLPEATVVVINTEAATV